MKKSSYVITLILLVLFIIFVTLSPSLYYKLYDYNSKDKYNINKINIDNENNTSNLDIESKVELMTNYRTNTMELEVSVDEDKYKNYINHIIKELEKIDPLCAKTFKDYYVMDYKDVYVYMSKLIISTIKNETIILNALGYSTKDGREVKIIFDSDNYILYSVECIWESKSGNSTKFKELRDDYLKYLNLSDNYNVDANIIDKDIFISLVFDIYEEKN